VAPATGELGVFQLAHVARGDAAAPLDDHGRRMRSEGGGLAASAAAQLQGDPSRLMKKCCYRRTVAGISA